MENRHISPLDLVKVAKGARPYKFNQSGKDTHEGGYMNKVGHVHWSGLGNGRALCGVSFNGVEIRFYEDDLIIVAS